ncbi:hypothetical protein BCL74_0434 [Oceanibaculum indicum]|uniref:Uncharacterized protein n=1 Tax=Oceanibaculum indicum TaxID=526216 RepID=A0A420WP69_9PROT|nr:hypothetical protein BCL74_0434 [Oceanibaculum indicum]
MPCTGRLLTVPARTGNYISMMYPVRSNAIRIIAPASVETPGVVESRSVTVFEGTSHVCFAHVSFERSFD